MSQEQVYGGDEVNAIVLDPGSHSTRAGWSAEDGPSISVPTAYAYTDGKRAYGDDETFVCKPNKEIRNPMHEGTVADFDAVSELWKYAMSQASAERNTKFLEECPLLITEQTWTDQKTQLKTLDFALNDLQSPAVYLAKSPTLSLFSAGRGTGLVVDIGAQVATITPVVDGICLKRPSRRSLRAGDFLSTKVEELLQKTVSAAGNEIVATYQVKSKQHYKLAEKSNAVLYPASSEATDSFRQYQVKRVCENFKECMVQVPEATVKPDFVYRTRTFELPDGLQLEFGKERYDLGNELFKPESEANSEVKENSNSETASNENDENNLNNSANSAEIEDAKASTWSASGLGDLIVESLNACDIDIRPNLANNIVITGGSSLVQGFTERVNQKIMQKLPMLKIRVFASGNLLERKSSAWIGGSILSSLGTFHQLWVSKQEYEECGGEHICQKRFR